MVPKVVARAPARVGATGHDWPRCLPGCNPACPHEVKLVAPLACSHVAGLAARLACRYVVGLAVHGHTSVAMCGHASVVVWELGLGCLCKCVLEEGSGQVKSPWSTILNIPGNNGIYDYIKEVWEESKYCNPLEITRKFANDEAIVEARRVKPVEMKSFQRMLHIFLMKNIAPRFGKRDVTSFMDLTYTNYLLTRKKVNLPRVIIRHMAYVINVPNHELPHGELLTRIFEAFNVPLDYRKSKDPIRIDFFEETFLKMCQLKREQGVWWLGIGVNRRRDEDEDAPAENIGNEEVN
ncbi:hypothetical protein Dimus_027298 [Dionaea muscipula]